MSTPEVADLLGPDDAARPIAPAPAQIAPAPSSTGPARSGSSPASVRSGRLGAGPRGRMVEFARFIIVALLAVGGWEVAAALVQDASGRLLGIVIGSGLGYVVGGVFGRRTASAVSQFEREFGGVPAAELLAGGIGLILALGVAALVSIPLFHLPPAAAFPTIAFLYGTLGYAGYRLGKAKSTDLFALFGVKARSSGTRPGEVWVLDTSVILDPRTVNLARLGFLSGTLLLPREVLEELQSVADSSDPVRRRRGQRALDLLVALRREPTVDMEVVEQEAEQPGQTVDGRVVRLARARGGVLLTNDGNLAKIAEALDVPVRSIHALAEAVRPRVLVGEIVRVPLSRPGRESGQAVGYLEDGTMVVVEAAEEMLGKTPEVTVTNTLQTATGRLLFGRLSDSD